MQAVFSVPSASSVVSAFPPSFTTEDTESTEIEAVWALVCAKLPTRLREHPQRIVELSFLILENPACAFGYAYCEQECSRSELLEPYWLYDNLGRLKALVKDYD